MASKYLNRDIEKAWTRDEDYLMQTASGDHLSQPATQSFWFCETKERSCAASPPNRQDAGEMPTCPVL